MEGYAARAASGPENRDIHRKVRGSTPHPSASFFLMRGRGAVIRPLDCLISSRRSFKSALRNQHGEVTGAAIGGDCKSPGLAFAGSSPAFLTNTRVKDYGSRRVCHTCSRGSTPRIRTNSRRDSSAVERWSEKPRVGCSTHPLGTNNGESTGVQSILARLTRWDQHPLSPPILFDFQRMRRDKIKHVLFRVVQR